MIRIIINADDCGYNNIINDHIRNCINLGKITSTSIMTNMSDFEGAIKLYKEYGKEVSFGIHLNLTEGKPLRNSQLLLDKGILKEKSGVIFFNGQKIRNSIVSNEILSEVRKEWEEQISKVLDYGVIPTHLDSHHHIHTGLFCWSLFPSLAKEFNIKRFRRMRNFTSHGKSSIIRNIWTLGVQLQNKGLRTTDYFAIAREYLDHISEIGNDNYCIEIMCHPGGDIEEENSILQFNFENNIKLISYHNI